MLAHETCINKYHVYAVGALWVVWVEHAHGARMSVCAAIEMHASRRVGIFHNEIGYLVKKLQMEAIIYATVAVARMHCGETR